MEFPISWVEALIAGLLALLTYIYRQDRLELKTQMMKFESDMQRNGEAMTAFTANMAIHQQKIQYLEKQLDAIFAMLREIRDEMRGKQDKSSH